MMITIGSDHRGYNLKTKIIQNFCNFVSANGLQPWRRPNSEFIEWINVGATSQDRVDYPVFAKKACLNILEGKAELGILICGSGVGMAIAANRFKKIYAALCWNKDVAKLARQDDGANVLVLPADFVSLETACDIIAAWLGAKFKGDEYKARLDMIDK